MFHNPFQSKSNGNKKNVAEKLNCLPVHKARKFSAVLGTSSPNRPKTILPKASPPASTSKKHLVVTLA